MATDVGQIFSFGDTGPLAPRTADQGVAPDQLQNLAQQLSADVEARLLARLEAWQREHLDEHVLRLVEDRLQEETERRSWRRGREVF